VDPTKPSDRREPDPWLPPTLAAILVIGITAGFAWHRPGDLARQPTLATNTRIAVNTAAGPQLQLLPGIGPGLAQRIVADRQQAGPFENAQALQRVRGIGERTIERLEPWITFEPVPSRERPGEHANPTR